MKCHRIGVHLTFSTYPKQPLFSCGGVGGLVVVRVDISKYVKKSPLDDPNDVCQYAFDNYESFKIYVEC